MEVALRAAGPATAQEWQGRRPVWRRLQRWRWQAGAAGRMTVSRIKPCLPSRSHQGPGWRLVEADPVEALQELGPISCVAVMPKKRQVLVEFEDVLGVGGRELRSFRSIWWALQLLSVILPARKYPAPGTRRTLRVPTVGFSLPSWTTSVTLPGTFFILSITLMVLPRELRFSRRMASRPWRTVCSVPSELRPYSPGAEMYSGCCSLKIEHAKPIGFKLFKNDQDTCDHTKPNLRRQGITHIPWSLNTPALRSLDQRTS